LLQFGLPGAAQSPQNASATKQIDAAIAEGQTLRARGDFTLAIDRFTRAAESAQRIGDLDRQAIALRESSACQLSMFHYREAIELGEASRTLAVRAKDDTSAGAAAILLCSIYRGLGDLALAEREADYAITKLENSPRKDFLALAFLSRGTLEHLEGKKARALGSVSEAIAVAHNGNIPATEGYAWDFSGLILLQQARTEDAEQALKKAVAIQTKINDTGNLAVTHEHLAELELQKKNYSRALDFIDQAFASNSPAFKINAQYYPVRVRAQILLGLGRTHDALLEFRRAVDLATEWRSGALPGDVTSTWTVAQLHDVYENYAELAATLALKNHDSALGRDALEALAENRAASLREQLALSLGRSMSLPPRYFELIAALQKEQARVTLGERSAEQEAKLREIRLQLSDLENKIGLEELDNSVRQEKNPHKNSLRSIQSRLGRSEVLLSFCLGRDKSFVWVVTGDELNLYELPEESAIADRAQAFANAARANQDTSGPGLALSRSLFGHLRPEVWRKRDWLLILDGVLLDAIPFSALPNPVAPSMTLTAERAIRRLPSELLLLQPGGAAPAPVFIGVADPIYNLADSRRATSVVKAKQPITTVNLARLVGSDNEVKAAAKLSGMPDAELLTGANASGDALRQAAGKRPEILHFAVHVVSPPARPQEAALALSLTNDGMPELLTSEVIASYRVPGSLVVMSGCASAQGKGVPGAGLIGLSRAWLLAGAVAVVVSAWPTPDDSGQFFSAFYTHLQKHSGPMAKRASAALEEAQLDMQHSSGYRSSPSFWAAYSIIAKE
jgi:CHAT domain-containing protein/predicted negative regulator of RcsB-dependent stress response